MFTFHPESGLAKLKAGAVTVTNLLQGDVPECVPGARIFNDAHYFPVWPPSGPENLRPEDPQPKAAIHDRVSSKLDAVLTLIDGERFSGDEKELAIEEPAELVREASQELEQSTVQNDKRKSDGKFKDRAGCPITSTIKSINYFDKVYFYANSRLPLNLPPLKLYISTYPLLCLAAQFSERVYTKPNVAEKETHIEADFRMGTKAMVIKSVPMDDMATIIFAIRGSQTFMDWAVNLKTAPASPVNFLDDPGNLCHSGFLSVARKMIVPVAARLRHLLYELRNGQQRSTKNYSLLITGHSAGGAVASLLYSHMLSTTPETATELREMMPCFKRIHCITFGSPPLSLLPITKPPGEKLKKSLFLSFVNEGDPVARADKKYVRSLLDLYTSPAPGMTCCETASRHTQQLIRPWATGRSKASHSHSDPTLETIKSATLLPKATGGAATERPSLPKSQSSPPPPPLPTRPAGPPPVWHVPESELSNAGRIVVLRSLTRYDGRPSPSHKHRMDEGIVAQTVSDEQLRGVVWGDPVCHMMSLYKQRVESLATNAVMGRG